MTEKQTTLTDALVDTSEFTPGKFLDTQSTASGDTLLSPTASDSFRRDDFERAVDELEVYAEHLDPESAEYQVVKRRLGEIGLVGILVEQATGAIDKSDQIHRMQEELYGHYSPDLFRASLRQKVALLEAVSVPEGVRTAKALLLDELSTYAVASEADAADVELERPDDETLRAVGDWIQDQFGDIFDEIDVLDGEELDAQHLVAIMNMAIETTPALRNNKWHADVIQRNKSAVSVFASNRSVVVPGQRRVSKAAAKKLVVHEVFGHALRSGIAETSGDEVGTTGTATYGTFEESFEIALEQCIDGVYDPKRGLDHYITVGLSETVGLSRDKIAQLTASMKQITLAGDVLSSEKVNKANTLTAAQIGRTFAGMTDVDDGIANRKDINYLHGLNGAWKLLNAIVKADQVDEGMKWLLSAKFNPYDAIDRRSVDRYSKMPSSIKEALGV